MQYVNPEFGLLKDMLMMHFNMLIGLIDVLMTAEQPQELNSLKDCAKITFEKNRDITKHSVIARDNI